jgi:hypothetical protein
MGRTVEMQPWITIRGQTGWAGIMQEVEDWLDTSRYSSAVVRVEVPCLSSCTLYLEGCDQSGGSFVVSGTFGTAVTTPSLVYLLRQAPFGASDRLSNLLRWRVVGPGSDGAWTACFRISVIFK